MKEECKFFDVKAKIVTNENAVDVINTLSKHLSHDEPFYVLDAGDIYQKIKTWRLKMPRVKIFYAVKCNSNSTVLSMLASLGVGFDCASKGEIQKILSLGVEPSRIVFAHPCKPTSHLKQAAKFKVDLMTFDNESELHKTKSIMPHARLLIRIRCDAAKAQAPLGVKFGVLPENVEPLLRTARELDLNIVGVAFHVGSGFQETQVFERAIMHGRNVFDEAISFGFNPTILDIGGGFPGQRSQLFEDAANVINDALEKYFPIGSGVEIIAEPGRYVVSSAFTLATSVISKREILKDDGMPLSTMYYMNDGVYGSFNCILYDHQEVKPIPLEKGPLRPCSVWGPTCDGLDQILSDTNLPELMVGDWIVWPNMGAYTIAAAGTFNGFPLPKVHVYLPYHTWMFFQELDISMVAQKTKPRTDEKYACHDQVDNEKCKDYSVDQLGNQLKDCMTILPFVDMAEM